MMNQMFETPPRQRRLPVNTFLMGTRLKLRLSQTLRKTVFTMATRKRYDPSQEQLALAKARKEKKMNKVLVTKDGGPPGPQLLSRRWLSLPHALNPEHPKKSRLKFMTWNVCRLLLSTYLYFTEPLP
jgi:hypothetical protein